MLNNISLSVWILKSQTMIDEVNSFDNFFKVVKTNLTKKRRTTRSALNTFIIPNYLTTFRSPFIVAAICNAR